jgi:integrase
VLDGLKTPKNGKAREVPLLPSVKNALAKLASSNPFGWDPERFIFYGTLPEKPVVENVLVEGFKDALAKAGVSEKQRKDRNIVFHSWRHYYAKVIADRVEQRQAQLALGHMTAAMTTFYADHKTEADLIAIERAVGDAFSGTLGF